MDNPAFLLLSHSKRKPETPGHCGRKFSATVAREGLPSQSCCHPPRIYLDCVIVRRQHRIPFECSPTHCESPKIDPPTELGRFVHLPAFGTVWRGTKLARLSHHTVVPPILCRNSLQSDLKITYFAFRRYCTLMLWLKDMWACLDLLL